MICENYHLAKINGTAGDRPRPQIDAWRGVQGWLSDDEAAELQRLAAGKKVLEVGTWNGCSAIAMAATADRVFTLDHFYGDEFAGYGNPGSRTWETIISAEARERVVMITADWRIMLPMLDLSGFGLIYYDADHTYRATKDFIETAAYKSDAIIAVHDYDDNPSHAGARQAVDESSRNLRVVDRLAILE